MAFSAAHLWRPSGTSARGVARPLLSWLLATAMAWTSHASADAPSGSAVPGFSADKVGLGTYYVRVLEFEQNDVIPDYTIAISLR